jgi:hypothetical protein
VQEESVKVPEVMVPDEEHAVTLEYEEVLEFW